MTIGTLDKLFSKYIRLKWADDKGYVACAACGKICFWKEIDCGHFMSRRHKSTRWQEKNCLPECKYCNRFSQGEQFKMGKEIDRRYGQGTADLMLMASRKSFKASKFELDALGKFYKEQINKLPNKHLL